MEEGEEVTITMTAELLALLELGFRGPRPGSNAFPLLQLGSPPNRLLGEDIAGLLRDGALTATPVSGEVETIRGGNVDPYGEIPDVEMTHAYRLTDLGRQLFARAGMKKWREKR